MEIKNFVYEEAFSRNLGWVTPEEQSILKKKKVAIAGMGGVGGVTLITLTRMGIMNYHLADFDTFEIANFNRQMGASMESVGKPKVKVMQQMALNINPEINSILFEEGINPSNIDAFLKDVGLVVDCIDYFAFTERQLLYSEAEKRNIPVIMSAPLGMGGTIIAFGPQSMTFENYFGFSTCPEDLKPVRFLVGLAPKLLHSNYLVYPQIVNFLKRRVPSLAAGCQFSSGLLATFALKILLNRGGVAWAPTTLQVDGHNYQFKKSWRPWGYRNPIFRIFEWIALKTLKAKD